MSRRESDLIPVLQATVLNALHYNSLEQVYNMLFFVSRDRERAAVAAGPRFLICYSILRTIQDLTDVAAGPRFLICYSINRRHNDLHDVAAGPRFLICYSDQC